MFEAFKPFGAKVIGSLAQGSRISVIDVGNKDSVLLPLISKKSLRGCLQHTECPPTNAVITNMAHVSRKPHRGNVLCVVLFSTDASKHDEKKIHTYNIGSELSQEPYT